MDEDGETILNVSSTNDQINLQPGEFKIFGNQASTTLSSIESEIYELTMYPNPSDEFIIFNKNIGLVKIYDITGKELLEYSDVLVGQQLSIQNLDSGYYIVKVETDNAITTKALIKK